jgi:hypothetical protein
LPWLFSDLHQRKIRPFNHNRKDMLPNFSPKHLQLKRGTLHPEYKETLVLCAGRRDKKYMSLVCPFNLKKQTSRKVRKL